MMLRLTCFAAVFFGVIGCGRERPFSSSTDVSEVSQEETPHEADADRLSPSDAAPEADTQESHQDFESEFGQPLINSQGRLNQKFLSLVRIGESERALRYLSELSETRRNTSQIRYLRGRLSETLGRWESAAQLFDLEPESLPREVVDDAAFRRARAWVKAENCGAARPLLKSLVKGTYKKNKARLLASECSLKMGEPHEALSELGSLLKRKLPAADSLRARVLLAEAQTKSKLTEEAQQTLRKLLVDYPNHGQASQIEKQLRSLGEFSGFSFDERIERAKKLLRNRRFSATIAELDVAKRPTRRADLAIWLHLRGMALYRSRHHYEEASKVLAEASRQRGFRALDDAFHSARALSRADHDDKAIKAYRRFVKAHPQHDRAAQAEYLAAWLELHHGKSQGEVMMKRFLDGPRAKLSSKLQGEAMWHLAFQAFKNKQYRKAADLFRRYSKTGSLGLVRGRGLYWQARAVEAAGHKRQAIKVYHQAIAVEPLHWYAVLSAHRLAKLGQDPGPAFPKKSGVLRKAPPPLPKVALPDDAAFYASIGLDEDALGALRKKESRIRASVPNKRGLEALITLYGQLGGTQRAFRLAMSRGYELRSQPGPANMWVWQAALPRPHLAQVEHYAKQNGIEPAHVYGTMRQESGYAPYVVSRADAIGLLQVLPSSAKRIAKRLDVPYKRSLLFDPLWNIRFGIAEISESHHAFDKQLPLVIAGYNAGDARVRRWLKKTGEIELDLFVERIPFNETRNYVRRVTTHYTRYRYLEDPTRPWPVPLPYKVGPSKNSR